MAIPNLRRHVKGCSDNTGRGERLWGNRYVIRFRERHRRGQVDDAPAVVWRSVIPVGAFVDQLGQPKIDELGGSGLGDDDVRRLDVPMQDSRVMYGSETTQQISCNGHHLG